MQYKVKKNYFTENTNRNLIYIFHVFFSTAKLKYGLDIKPAKGFISYFLFLIEPLLGTLLSLYYFFKRGSTLCHNLDKSVAFPVN